MFLISHKEFRRVINIYSSDDDYRGQHYFTMSTERRQSRSIATYYSVDCMILRRWSYSRCCQPTVTDAAVGERRSSLIIAGDVITNNRPRRQCRGPLTDRPAKLSADVTADHGHRPGQRWKSDSVTSKSSFVCLCRSLLDVTGLHTSAVEYWSWWRDGDVPGTCRLWQISEHCGAVQYKICIFKKCRLATYPWLLYVIKHYIENSWHVVSKFVESFSLNLCNL